MEHASFSAALKAIVERDDRYDERAYHFVREALDFTIKDLDKPTEGPGRHVSGQELLNGIRSYAVREYGPMAMTVLNRWGINATNDFGEIVFNMVEEGILGKTQNDCREDFHGSYNFEEAFREPFLPRRLRGGTGHTANP